MQSSRLGGELQSVPLSVQEADALLLNGLTIRDGSGLHAKVVCAACLNWRTVQGRTQTKSSFTRIVETLTEGF